MTAREFWDAVEAEAGLEYVGVATFEGEEGALVRGARGHKWHLPLREIIRNSWRDVREVLAGERDATILCHITRIVGYYSRVGNWNRSKLAELRDRQAGDYAFPETSFDLPRQQTPDEVLEEIARATDSRMVCDLEAKEAGA